MITNGKTTYAIAGTGTRGLCYARTMVDSFSDVAPLVGLYDRNQTRMRSFCESLERDIPCFTSFSEMVKQAAPQVLIVCTPDQTHDEMIELAFLHGMDVICEKPMATTKQKVHRIFELEKQFDRKVRVTFNLRYATYAQRLKIALQQADIGPIRSANLEWCVDRTHGAEYFRRWHRSIENSGGMLVHKSTHHFDLINWLVQDEPVDVSANGALLYYGKAGPLHGRNCRSCEHASACPHYLDINAGGDESMDRLRSMYVNAEHEDGYERDRCVFGEDINIHDTMSAVVNYRSGAQLAYSLCTYSPSEGYRLSLIGTRGRIEAQEYFGGLLIKGEVTSAPIRIVRGTSRDDVALEQLDVAIDTKDHGGGDERLYQHLFEPDRPDPLGQIAGSRDGAASCLIGIAANESIQTGRRVAIDLPNEIIRRAPKHPSPVKEHA